MIPDVTSVAPRLYNGYGNHKGCNVYHKGIADFLTDPFNLDDKEINMLIILGILALIIGVIIGATGVGGILLIPVLAYFGGLSIHEAMGTALFSFFFTGVIATSIYHRYGSINWKITIPVCVGSFFSSYLGAYANAFCSPVVLKLALAGVIVLSSAYSMLPVKNSNLAQKLGLCGNRILLLGIGLFVGFFSGLTGAGGGVISIPLMLIFGFATLPSIATGQVLQSIVAVSASVSNFSNGFIVFSLVWWVIILELLGVAVGVRIAHMVDANKLKKSVSIICLVIGVLITLQTFINHSDVFNR